MIKELRWYLVECDGCGLSKEVSTIYDYESVDFVSRMKEVNKWSIIRTQIIGGRGYFIGFDEKIFCAYPACQIAAEMYREIKTKENKG